jgi:hypothetical protein
MAVDEHPGHAVGDRGAQAAHRGGHHGGPTGLRLDGHQTEGLAIGRDDGDVGRAVPVGQRVLGLRLHEADAGAETEVAGQLLQGMRLPGAAPGRAADHRDDEAVTELGPGLEQPGGGPQEDVGRLQRLEAADEEQEVGVLRDAETAAGSAPRAGGEQAEVDARGHGHDLAGVGAVEVDELVGLLVGVGDQAVGGGDDLGLTDRAGSGLGGVTLGQRQVLDPRHGVHRVDERHVPALGGQPGHLAGEPVVGVHEVVPAGRPGRLQPHQAGREGAQLGRQVLLGQPLEGASRHVPDRHARRQLDGGRQVRAGRPGDHVDLHAQRGQAAGQLDDVHVHAAGVAGAWLVQGGGVHGDHRETSGQAAAAPHHRHRHAAPPVGPEPRSIVPDSRQGNRTGALTLAGAVVDRLRHACADV